jgi:hypothetical protein
LRVAGAIHVYGDDFFAASRSEWDPETLLAPVTFSESAHCTRCNP